SGPTGPIGPTGSGGEIVVSNISGGTYTVTGTTLDVTGSVSGGTISVSSGALDIGGSLSGATITLNSSVSDIGGSVSGGSVTLTSSDLELDGAVSGGNFTLNNNSMLLLSTSPSGGTITYGSGTNTAANSVAITTIGTTNSVALAQLNDGDSIAESNIPFTSASLSGHTLTLKNGTSTVATFSNVTLAGGASSTFEPVTTETIGGKTYYVATLDPPSGATGTGSTGATGASSGGGSGHDKLTAEINPGNLFGPQDHGPRFLYVAGPATGQPGHTPGAQGTDLLIRAGTDFIQNFSLAQGDKLDLTKILAGAPLAHDLANLGNFVKVLGSGHNDPGFGPGTKTSLEVTGPHGSAVVNLEGVGKLELSDLLKHHSLLLPPH
ncbi:MAG: type I secretion C-terminal target domain-containing protein, partial [Stellaceae bacterium]